jgi:brefeldin A-inhibited guanine nucleotide-exchange protein
MSSHNVYELNPRQKEIEVLLHEIFIPILEMRTSTLKQKAVILGMLSRLCQDPQALVEIYLNYDCDGDAADNIYEQCVLSTILIDLMAHRHCSLINIISKFASMPVSAMPQKGTEPTSPALNPSQKNAQPTVASSLGNSVMNVPGSLDTSSMGLSDGQLRRQGIECLVSVLRSLVAWGVAVGKGDDGQAGLSNRSQPGDEVKHESTTPDTTTDRLSATSSETFRQPTPEPVDDPTRFESAKQKKTTLLEGLKKFNFKPKKVLAVFFLFFELYLMYVYPGYSIPYRAWFYSK